MKKLIASIFFLTSLAFMVVSFSFEPPVVTIYAKEGPIKIKPDIIWTKPFPNKDYIDFCVYNPARCEAETPRLRIERLDQISIS